MKTNILQITLAFIISTIAINAFAYDIAVKNSDGVTIHYNYINNGTELSVAYAGYSASYAPIVNIPEEVTYMDRIRKVTRIGYKAFSGAEIKSIIIPNTVTSIDDLAFSYCKELQSISIGTGVKRMENQAFYDCYNIEKVIIKDIAAWCEIQFGTYGSYISNPLRGGHIYSDEDHEITNLVIPDGVTNIGDYAFKGGVFITSLSIPNSVKRIGDYAFWSCRNLTTLSIPNGVLEIGKGSFGYCDGLSYINLGNTIEKIGEEAFAYCYKLTSLNVPKSVNSIGYKAFEDINLTSIVSFIETPFEIGGKSYEKNRVFSLNTYNNATLYVPIGSIEKYKSTYGWKDFLYIEEGDGSGNTPSDRQKCAKPTINYQNGKLIFNCETDGAVCQSIITDTDIASYSGNEVQLSVTYLISVYATKNGYENSDTSTATLCWIDIEPKAEGLNSIAQVRANAIMIKTDGGLITVEGSDDNIGISVYSLDGVQVGSTISRNGVAYINTNLTRDSIAIVKIGDRSVKVLLK